MINSTISKVREATDEAEVIFEGHEKKIGLETSLLQVSRPMVNVHKAPVMEATARIMNVVSTRDTGPEGGDSANEARSKKSAKFPSVALGQNKVAPFLPTKDDPDSDDLRESPSPKRPPIDV